MKFEDWKKMILPKSLDAKLLWLLDSQERYLNESQAKWEVLMHCSALIKDDGFKKAIKRNEKEADRQKERYEWLLQHISENYILKNHIDKDLSDLELEDIAKRIGYETFNKIYTTGFNNGIKFNKDNTRPKGCKS